MENGYKMMRDCVYHNPHLLGHIKDPKLLKIADNLLPERTGIEFSVEVENFSKLYKLWRNDVVKTMNYTRHPAPEFQVQLYNGIKGMKGLYDTCKALKKESSLNMAAGLHYHCNLSKLTKFIEKNELQDRILTIQSKVFYNTPKGEHILKSLNSWNYEGEYNHRGLTFQPNCAKNKWIVLRTFFPEWDVRQTEYTLEFRIASMKFDYTSILKEIIQAHRLANYYTKEIITFCNKSL